MRWEGEDGIDVDEAFTEFFRVHLDRVRRRMRRSFRDDAVVEEVCADVFIIAHRRFGEIRKLADPQIAAWLYRTADYVARNHRRGAIRYRRAIERLEQQPIDAQPEPFDVASGHEDLRRTKSQVSEILDQLELRHRAVLELAEFEHLSGPQIATKLGISPQAARLRLMRARRAFRRSYEDRFGTQS